MHLGTILKVLIATIVLYQKPMQISQKKIAEWNSKKDFFYTIEEVQQRVLQRVS